MKKNIFIASFLIVLVTACAQSITPTANVEKMQVSVSILPQKFFVEEIGGDQVAVNVMVGPGDSPHTYEPSIQQMKALDEADIYFTIGVEFEEAWMPRIQSANPEMQIVNLSDNLEKLPMRNHSHETAEDSHSDSDHDETD